MAPQSLTFLSFTQGMIGRDGYGYAARCILKAMACLQDVRSIDLADDADTLGWQVDGPGVVMSLPDWWPFVHADPLIGFTMHEASRIPPEWPAKINRTTAACIVPCEHNRRVFAESGVTVPIHVAKFGVDPEHYWPLGRKREGWEPYTFLWHGNGGSDLRKGWDVAYRAFRLAFGDRADVRLVLHFRQPLCGFPVFGDPNVEMLIGYLDRPAWRGLLETADVFVYPCRGEGWGLPPREAAATGLPALVTNWGGTAEEIGFWAMPIDVKRMAPAQYGPYPAGDVGDWAEPDVDHVVELMRFCEEHREEAASIGETAAAFLSGTTWERTARAIINTVEEVSSNGR